MASCIAAPTAFSDAKRLRDEAEAKAKAQQDKRDHEIAIRRKAVDEDILERAERLLQPEAVCILPGSHHFHADPETALQTAQEVEKCLMKGWNLAPKQQSKLWPSQIEQDFYAY